VHRNVDDRRGKAQKRENLLPFFWPSSISPFRELSALERLKGRCSLLPRRASARPRTWTGSMGWVGNFRRTRYRGVERTTFAAYLVVAVYNLLRIAKLCPDG